MPMPCQKKLYPYALMSASYLIILVETGGAERHNRRAEEEERYQSLVFFE